MPGSILFTSFLLPLLAGLYTGELQQMQTFTDPRDGRGYGWVNIGTQTWMTGNLNYEIDDSWCYDLSEKNCEKYGRLYTWEAATKACPDGWHLPAEEEWNTLERYLGMSGQQIDSFYMRGEGMGTLLKDSHAWEPGIMNESGYDIYGFKALPGGIRLFTDGSFVDLGVRGSWWSSTPNGRYAMRRSLFLDRTGIDRDAATVTLGFSIRCVRDTPLSNR